MSLRFVETSTRLVEMSTRLVEMSTRFVEMSTRFVEMSTRFVETSTRLVETSTRLVETSTRFVEMSLRGSHGGAKGTGCPTDSLGRSKLLFLGVLRDHRALVRGFERGALKSPNGTNRDCTVLKVFERIAVAESLIPRAIRINFDVVLRRGPVKMCIIHTIHRRR